MKSIVLFTTVLRIIIITVLIAFTIFVNAQSVAVNTTGNSADASAMLDISSNSKGVLITRLSTAQRIGIGTPAEGLFVYDTDTKGFWYFSLGAWKEIPKASAGGFTLPYNVSASNNTGLFSITNTNAVIGASGLYGKSGINSSGLTPLASSGVWGENSNGIGVSGTSKSIGVFGATGLNDQNGMGVLGISSSTTINNGAVTAINQSSGTAVYAESLDSGIAVYGKTTKQNGAAIYGINNAVQGHAIRGSATGNGGVAIYGEAGNAGSTSYAGYFRNSNALNGTNVVQIDNLGTGNFLSLTNGLGDIKTTISKNGQINTDGNIYTQGDLYVNGLKGIVRNTYSNQMRMEVMNVTVPGGFHFVVSSGGFGEVFINTQEITVTFNTPFTQAPAVYRANIVTPSTGSSIEFLDYRIYDVTTTGFKIEIYPSSSMDFVSVTTTFKFVAVGND